MYYKLLACDVFTRELCLGIAQSPHAIAPVFLPKGEHNQPDRLRSSLQAQIDAVEAEETNYDAILLAYGLCGNATADLRARSISLVIPRAHDCTTLFLGSKADFEEHFGDNPSQGWASVGYAERGGALLSDGSTREGLGPQEAYAEMVAQYGEENAKYLWESMHPPGTSEDIIFIDVPEIQVPKVRERIEAEAKAAEKALRVLPGSMRLLNALLSGAWDEDDFLVVPPQQRISPRYDREIILEAGE
jgi:hypothetical protein